MDAGASDEVHARKIEHDAAASKEQGQALALEHLGPLPVDPALEVQDRHVGLHVVAKDSKHARSPFVVTPARSTYQWACHRLPRGADRRPSLDGRGVRRDGARSEEGWAREAPA